MIRNRLLVATLLLGSSASSASAATTVEVTNFGSNPGKLRMFKHIPDKLPTSAALVVVMHGCTQDAVTYTNESGWIQMADQLHVALVRWPPRCPLRGGHFFITLRPFPEHAGR